jgi:hypothetical protein
MLNPNSEAPRYWRDRDLTFKRVSEICDNAMHNTCQFQGVKKYLAQAAIIRYLLLAAPFGMLTHHAMRRDMDRNPIPKAGDNRKFQRYLTQASRPIQSFHHACQLVNLGAFQGTAPAEFTGQDVFEFLDHVEADTAYLDPPYYGTATYDDQYAPLEEWLGGIDVRTEAFSKKDLFEELIGTAKRFPTLIITYGGSTTAKEALDIARKHRKDARLIPVRHRHSRGTMPGKGARFGNEILIHCPGD